MTQPHHRKLRRIMLQLDGTDYSEQLQTGRVVNNTGDPERFFTFGPVGEFLEPAEPEWALELTLYSDWRSSGISAYLTENDNQIVPFTFELHPGVTGEHVRYTGNVLIKAPSAGGEARAQDMTEVTLQIEGKPTFEQVVTP